MIRTVNGLNKSQIHLPSHIGLELYANSIRINSEIEDMDLDRTLHLQTRLNSLPIPNSKTYDDDTILQWHNDDEGIDVCGNLPPMDDHVKL